ncbi:MAG: FMN-binding protein [Deltaproteobacteria bacterium]|nr:FMN-binding protein [Deltaproteobacteria bacterium]
MRRRRHFARIALIGALCLVLAGCAPSQSGHAPTPTPPPTPSPSERAAAVLPRDARVEAKTFRDWEIFAGLINDAPVGYAYPLTVAPNEAGRMSDTETFRVMLGLDAEGRIVALSSYDLSPRAVYAPKLTGPDFQANLIWKDQTKGVHRTLHNTAWKLKVDGGQVDAASGATSSSRALAEQVFDALRHHARMMRAARVEKAAPTPKPSPPTGSTPSPSPSPDESKKAAEDAAKKFGAKSEGGAEVPERKTIDGIEVGTLSE